MVIFSVVVGGAFQATDLINRSINETRNLALVNDDTKKHFNRLIKQAAQVSIEYQLHQITAFILIKCKWADAQTIKLRAIHLTCLIVQEARMADAFVSFHSTSINSYSVALEISLLTLIGARLRKSGGHLQMTCHPQPRKLLIDNTSNASISSFNSIIDNSTIR